LQYIRSDDAVESTYKSGGMEDTEPDNEQTNVKVLRNS
jgi:hypothetical protein